MKNIIFEDKVENEIYLDKVNRWSPIFAKKGDKLCGMVIQEGDSWILKIGSTSGATGYHDSLKACLESCLVYGYQFFVN